MSEGSHQPVGLIETPCSHCGAPVQFTLGTLRTACSHCGSELMVTEDSPQRWIGAECPACGGPFLGIDGDDTACCPYCHTGVLIQRRRRLARLYYSPLPRAEVEARIGAPLRLLMAPYFRLRGLALGWQVGWETARPAQKNRWRGSAEELELGADREPERGLARSFHGRVVQLTAPDTTTRRLALPPLGVKPWLLPLQLYRPGVFVALGAEALASTSDPGQMESGLQARAVRPPPVGASFERLWERTSLVRPRLDLIYAPFYLRGDGALFDGTSAVAVGAIHGDLPLANPAAEPREGLIAVIVLRCPTCAVDLPLARFAAAARCGACGRLWQLTDDGLQPVGAAFAAPRERTQGRGPDPLYLPYWKLRLDPDPLLRPPGGGSLIHVPGHGDYRIPRIDYIARTLNRSQVDWNCAEPIGNRLIPCFLDQSEALELAFPYYFQQIRVGSRRLLERLRNLELLARDPELIFFPFASIGRELHGLAFSGRYDSNAVLRPGSI
jgi:DNA-directed RNA polymerase subunit RPC12/RpoP